MDQLNKREVVFDNIVLIKNKNDIAKKISDCTFTQAIYKGIKYNNNYTNKDRTYMTFKCSNYQSKEIKCQAMITVNINYNTNDNKYNVTVSNETNHSTGCLLKEKSEENSQHDNLHEYANFIVEYMPYLSKMKIGILFSIEGEQLNKLDNILKTRRKQLNCYSIETLLNSSNKLITFNSDEDMIIFTQKWAIECIHHSTILYGDGTFKCICSDFQQLFIISAKINENYFNTIFVLLKNKDESTYKEMFRRINEYGKTIINDFTITDKKRMFITDFETGLISTIKSYPLVIHQCCSFHMKQSIRNKLNSLGFPKKVSVDKNENDYSYSDESSSSSEDDSESNENDYPLKLQQEYDEIVNNMRNKLNQFVESKENEENESSEELLTNSEESDINEFEKKRVELKRYNISNRSNKNNFEKSIMMNKSIGDDQIKQIKYLLKTYYENENEIETPSFLLNTRNLIRCCMNICYLNKSFNIEKIVEILFIEMFKVCKSEYHTIITNLEKYMKETWLSSKTLFKGWNIFGSDATTNNVSETTNSHLNTDLPDGKKISVPLFFHKIKLAFYFNQKRLQTSKTPNAKPQTCKHTKYKNSLIALLQYFLFTNQLDPVSFLDFITDCINIKKYTDRKTVLQNIIQSQSKKIVVIRKIYLLQYNYSYLSSFEEEKKIYFSWIKENIENKTLLGKFLSNFVDQNDLINSSEKSNEMNDSEDSRTDTSYNSDEIDEETKEMISPLNNIDEILKEFDNEEKKYIKNYQLINITNDQMISRKKSHTLYQFEKLEKISSKLEEIKTNNLVEKTICIDQNNENDHSLFHISKSDKISNIIPPIFLNNTSNRMKQNEIENIMKAMKEDFVQLEMKYEQKRTNDHKEVLSSLNQLNQLQFQIIESLNQQKSEIKEVKRENEILKKEIEQLKQLLLEKEEPKDIHK